MKNILKYRTTWFLVFGTGAGICFLTFLWEVLTKELPVRTSPAELAVTVVCLLGVVIAGMFLTNE